MWTGFSCSSHWEKGCGVFEAKWICLCYREALARLRMFLWQTALRWRICSAGNLRKERFGHIDLCYTRVCFHAFPAAGSAIPVLPLTGPDQRKQDTKSIRNLILYEPDASEVFDAIVPEYLAGLIYGAVCESVASELAARRTAMEAATNNAEEMIEKLNLHYNRARQASITQEITEIVGGAEGSLMRCG